jgi:hypothetical protein
MLAALVIGGLAVAAAAQGAPGWPMGRIYDPKTVETVKGEIVAVETITAGKTDIPARVLLKLKTAKETLLVYLGPDWYLEKQGVKLVAGDQVEVRGSRVILDNQPTIIPNTVKKGDKVMEFWDDQGMPRWGGRGAGMGPGMGRGQGPGGGQGPRAK